MVRRFPGFQPFPTLALLATLALIPLGLFRPACCPAAPVATGTVATTVEASAAVSTAAGVPAASAAEVLTTDIQEGIERHIVEQTRIGSGVFHVAHEPGDLHLKLVRIHLEYLATLGPRRHFACVDMASEDGTFYDIDFFLEGDPGAMVVTETTVHKINGRPLYVWREQAPKNWGRVPADQAAKELLGVKNGEDHFDFRYQATLPVIATQARLWLPLARSTPFQEVATPSIRVPGKSRLLKDAAHGNHVLFLELGPQDSGGTIDIGYQVKRVEVAAYEGDAQEATRHLSPDRRVPVDDRFRSLAAKLTQGKPDALMKARALYDHVIDRMAYKKCGEGWGQGDAVRACSTPAGNCTDFHSYFIALARAAGIPARFFMGVALPSERNDGGVDGYHCWAEFYANGKWWPVDISEGNKFTALSMYYFGHHPANRFELSIGRDLVVDPGPASGPMNFLAYPLLEMEGQVKTLPVRFTFKRAP